jgi:hypothetical protein
MRTSIAAVGLAVILFSVPAQADNCRDQVRNFEPTQDTMGPAAKEALTRAIGELRAGHDGECQKWMRAAKARQQEFAREARRQQEAPRGDRRHNDWRYDNRHYDERLYEDRR